MTTLIPVNAHTRLMVLLFHRFLYLFDSHCSYPWHCSLVFQGDFRSEGGYFQLSASYIHVVFLGRTSFYPCQFFIMCTGSLKKTKHQRGPFSNNCFNYLFSVSVNRTKQTGFFILRYIFQHYNYITYII